MLNAALDVVHDLAVYAPMIQLGKVLKPLLNFGRHVDVSFDRLFGHWFLKLSGTQGGLGQGVRLLLVRPFDPIQFPIPSSLLLSH